MDRLYFEVPGISRREDAAAFINEFYEYGSEINGTGGLQHFAENYEGWLEKLERDYMMVPGEERVPARTYFLVRESDRRIVGMINIRLALNEHLRRFGGHIGYSIRPTERGKGYGRQMMLRAIDAAVEHFGAKRIEIEAQQYAKAFYERVGFEQSSDTYMLDGIMHIKMIWTKR